MPWTKPPSSWAGVVAVVELSISIGRVEVINNKVKVTVKMGVFGKTFVDTCVDFYRSEYT